MYIHFFSESTVDKSGFIYNFNNLGNLIKINLPFNYFIIITMYT